MLTLSASQCWDVSWEAWNIYLFLLLVCDFASLKEGQVTCSKNCWTRDIFGQSAMQKCHGEWIGPVFWVSELLNAMFRATGSLCLLTTYSAIIWNWTLLHEWYFWPVLKVLSIGASPAVMWTQFKCLATSLHKQRLRSPTFIWSPFAIFTAGFPQGKSMTKLARKVINCSGNFP